jgi:hypothetical protein
MNALRAGIVFWPQQLQGRRAHGAFVRSARASPKVKFFSKAISHTHTHSKVEKKETGLKAKNALARFLLISRSAASAAAVAAANGCGESTFLSRAGI